MGGDVGPVDVRIDPRKAIARTGAKPMGVVLLGGQPASGVVFAGWWGSRARDSSQPGTGLAKIVRFAGISQLLRPRLWVYGRDKNSEPRQIIA
jgi:hypothetical protein